MRRGSTSRTCAVGGEQVERGRARRRRATAATTPCRRTSRPSASRSHCSRPHGSRADQRARPGPGPRRWAAARGTGRSRRSSRSSVDRWSATENSVSRSTSSPHRSMRTGRVGGGREHVDDRAPHRDLAAVLDLVLAPVAGGDEPLDELGRVELLARAARRAARRPRRAGRAAAPGPAPAPRPPRGARSGVAQAPDASAGGGPWSRRPG